MSKNKLKAVIFDFDGTIVDSEKIYQKFWPIAFSKYGYKLSKQRGLNLRSLGQPHLFRTVEQWFGKDIDFASIKEYRRKIMDEYVDKHGVAIKKGIKSLFDWLTKCNIQIVIATSGIMTKTTKYLKMVKLEKYIANIITTNHIKNGKPSPDIYKYAYKSINVKPSQCIAIEDCPNGVIAAVRAKLDTIMIPDLTNPGKELSKYKFTCLKDASCVKKYILDNYLIK